MSETQSKAFKEFYNNLRTKNGACKINKFDKNKERKIRNLNQIRCEGGKVLFVDQNIREMRELISFSMMDMDQLIIFYEPNGVV